MNELQKSRTEEIIRLHGEAENLYRMTLEKAVQIGQLLIDQKKSMKHGDFTEWIENGMPFTPRTARRYMGLCEEKEILETDNVSVLSDAYYEVALQKRRVIEEKRAREMESMEKRYRVYEWPEDRERVLFQNKSELCFCVALGPGEETPYIETADFKITDEELFDEINRQNNQEEAIALLLGKYECGECGCTVAGTWGNYFNPKSDAFCQRHFIRSLNGPGPRWIKSGLEHGIPEEAFKADIRLCAVDPRTEEEKLQEEIYRAGERIEKENQRHEKEIKKLEGKIQRLLSEDVEYEEGSVNHA